MSRGLSSLCAGPFAGCVQDELRYLYETLPENIADRIPSTEKCGMRSLVVIVLGAVIGWLFLGANSTLAQNFQKLTGGQIQARFAGMELTDDTHWRDHFGRNGSLTIQSMGRKRAGKWRVEKNELCLDYSKDEGGCYEVWLAGTNVELRWPENVAPAVEGKLQRPIMPD